ncbi:MAG TPA: lytic transglycosylase domain-containing protein [Pantanalinema sp.]
MTRRAHVRPRARLRRFVLALAALALLLALARPAGVAAARLFFPFPYREAIEREAERYSLDPLLVVAVMRVESGFAPRARSRVGARGLMQLMPSTAAWAARKVSMRDFSAEGLEDPDTNIRLGCWYLSYLRRQFPGDLHAMLAAYNGGEGNVARWKRQPEALEAAYPETRAYVRRSIRAYRIYRLLYRDWAS